MKTIALISMLFISLGTCTAMAAQQKPFLSCNNGGLIIYSSPGLNQPTNPLTAVLKNQNPQAVVPEVESAAFDDQSSSGLWVIGADDFTLTVYSNGTVDLTENGQKVSASCINISNDPIPSGFSAGN